MSFGALSCRASKTLPLHSSCCGSVNLLNGGVAGSLLLFHVDSSASDWAMLTSSIPFKMVSAVVTSFFFSCSCCSKVSSFAVPGSSVSLSLNSFCSSTLPLSVIVLKPSISCTSSTALSARFCFFVAVDFNFLTSFVNSAILVLPLAFFSLPCAMPRLVFALVAAPFSFLLVFFNSVSLAATCCFVLASSTVPDLYPFLSSTSKSFSF